MQVSSYVGNKIEDLGLKGYESRIFGNLAVAGIYPESKVTTTVASSVDSLLAKLSKKLGAVAAPKKLDAQVEKAQTEKLAQSQQYTNMLLKGIDPATGDPLTRIDLLGGIEALHNSSTRVVYPIPGTDKLPEYV